MSLDTSPDPFDLRGYADLDSLTPAQRKSLTRRDLWTWCAACHQRPAMRGTDRCRFHTKAGR